MSKPVIGLVLASVLWALSAVPSAAQLHFHDAFDYAAGGLDTVSSPNWVGASVAGGDDIQVVDGNLTVSGLKASSGRMVNFAGAGRDFSRDFGTQQTTGEVFFSFALNVNSMAGVTNASGGHFAGLIQGNSATDGNFGAVIWARRVGTNDNLYNLGISVRSTGTTTWDSTAYSTGSTNFVVGSYRLIAGATNDEARLWVNPNPSSFGAVSAPTPTVLDTDTTADLNGAGRFYLRQDSATQTGNYNLDEIRAGSSWAAVTPATAIPEPTTWALLGLGSAGVGYWRWRRHHRKNVDAALAASEEVADEELSN